MVDFACKVGEYRDYTEKLLPVKLMREWTSLFVTGQPLYDAQPTSNNDGDIMPNPDQVLLEDRLRLGDRKRYGNFDGDLSSYFCGL